MKKTAIAILLLSLWSLQGFGQQQLLMADDRVSAIDTVWVFTPKSYRQNQEYPIVYMLHGYSGNYRQWHEIMDAAQYAEGYQMIIVCPDGFYNSWYFNSPLKPKSQFADFFFEVLIPRIENQYRIDTANRFITGLSMGGHGAFYLFLRQPELFRSAGSTSGVMDLRGSAGSFGLDEHLGESKENEDRWLSFSVVGNIDKFKMAEKELIFDCGTEDPFYQWNKVFYEKCLENKVPVTFISRPGKHDWNYWKQSIKSHFEFFQARIR